MYKSYLVQVGNRYLPKKLIHGSDVHHNIILPTLCAVYNI